MFKVGFLIQPLNFKALFRLQLSQNATLGLP